MLFKIPEKSRFVLIVILLFFTACGDSPTDPESDADSTPGLILGAGQTPQGITLVAIPGGTFQMGSASGPSNEQPEHQVTVSGFSMSGKEITNAQYAEYLKQALADGEITATESSVTGAKGDYSGQLYIEVSRYFDGSNDCWIRYKGGRFSVASGKEKWPVIFVTWYGAKAFAEKYGFDLPREAEWEYAARGGKQYECGTNDGRINTSKANYYQIIGYPKNVGSYSKNPFGLYDMAGNVWEWCSDWYGSYGSSSQTDPSGPSNGVSRLVRGGSWYDFFSGCRTAYRFFKDPDIRTADIGFRVVRR